MADAMLDPDQVKYLRSLVRMDRKRQQKNARGLVRRFGDEADLSRVERKNEFIEGVQQTLDGMEPAQ